MHSEVMLAMSGKTAASMQQSSVSAMPDSAAVMGSSPKPSNSRLMIKLNSRMNTKISSVWRSAAIKMLLDSSCSSWQSTSSAWPS